MQFFNPVYVSRGNIGVQPKFGVGIVWRLLERRGGGARPDIIVGSVSWRGCEGRHGAGSYGDLMGLARRGLAKHLRVGTRPNVDTRSTRHVVGGALRGRSPRTREGRIGPTAQNCSGQWSVVSGQRGRLFWRQLEWEPTMAWAPPEV